MAAPVGMHFSGSVWDGPRVHLCSCREGGIAALLALRPRGCQQVRVAAPLSARGLLQRRDLAPEVCRHPRQRPLQLRLPRRSGVRSRARRCLQSPQKHSLIGECRLPLRLSTAPASCSAGIRLAGLAHVSQGSCVTCCDVAASAASWAAAAALASACSASSAHRRACAADCRCSSVLLSDRSSSSAAACASLARCLGKRPTVRQTQRKCMALCTPPIRSV